MGDDNHSRKTDTTLVLNSMSKFFITNSSISFSVPSFSRHSLMKILIASCLYILLIVVSSDVLDGDLYEQRNPDYAIDGDTALTTCILQWNLNTLKKTWDLGITEAPIFFPCKYAKFYSEHLFSHMVFAYPLSFLMDSPYAIHEVTYQLNRFTIAMAMFFLCWTLTGAFSSSLVAAALILSGWHFGQLQNTGLGWAILSMLFFIKHLQSAKWKYAIGMACFSVLAGFSSGYLLLFTPIALFLLLIVRVVAKKAIPSREWFLQIACVLIFVFAVLSPALMLYKKVQDELGLKRTHYRVARFVPVVLPAAEEKSEKDNFVYSLSWIACAQILLFACGLVLAIRKRFDFDKWQFGFCVLVIVSFWMASYRLSPFLLLSALPGYDGLRAAMRWSLFLAVSVTVMNAMTLDYLLNKRQAITKIVVTLTILSGLLLLLNFEQPFQKDRRFRQSEVQAFLLTLPRGPICILPLPNKNSQGWPRITSARMLFQLNHKFPMTSGYSGFSPRLIDVMERKIYENGLSNLVVRNLSRTGVKYVVVDTLAGDTSGIRQQIKSLRDLQVLYDRNGEMVALLPSEDRSRI